MRVRQTGFSILEMLMATVILLVGLVAVAQLVPVSISLNQQNRLESQALVFAQRELDQMLGQPVGAGSFTDALGNVCQLGDPTIAGVQGAAVGADSGGRPIILFGAPNPPLAPASGYGFTYADANGAMYDVRWAVIVFGNGSIAYSKRLILGVRQIGGNGFFQPVTLDTMVSK